MNFYIRTNANKKIGLGHLSRSLKLAEHCSNNGHNVEIILDRKEELLKNFFRKKIKFTFLYKNKKYLNEALDIELLKKHIKKNSIMILDDYRFGYVWQKKIKQYTSKLILIEDQNIKDSFADILINSNPKFLDEKNYVNRNKFSNAVFLLGPKYAIVNKIKKKKFLSNKKNITFYLGGSGDLAHIHRIINNLKEVINKKNFVLNIIVGPLSKNIDKIISLKKNIKNLIIHKDKTNLTDILRSTDILIASSGMILAEAAIYKIPSICFQLSPNQIIEDKYLEQIGYYINLDKKFLSDHNNLKKLIYKILSISLRFNKIFPSKFNIDTNGVSRIFKAINSNNLSDNNSLSDLKKREFKVVNDTSINSYLTARNLLMNRINSSNKKKINKIEHYLWWLQSKKNITTVTQNKKNLMFIRNDILKLKNVYYCLNGFVVANKAINGLDVIWGLKKNLDYLNQKYRNLILLSVVKKTNKFANMHTKFLNYYLYDNRSKQINKILKARFKNLEKLNVYVNKQKPSYEF